MTKNPSGKTRSHRTIWSIAGVALSLALIAFALRVAQESRSDSDGAAADRGGIVEEMIERLRTDPRVRRPGTRRSVEAAARLADDGGAGHAEVQYALGLKKYYGESDFEGAEGAYSEAIRLRPDWSWPHNGLGILWFSIGREAEALRSFERAMDLEPGWSRPHGDLAILYRRAGRMDEALREAQTALDIEPEDPINHFNYGVILDQPGSHVEARSRYERALELAPKMPEALYNLACSYAREGDLEQALPYLIESIRLVEDFREDARNDPDFDAVRERPGFRTVADGDVP